MDPGGRAAPRPDGTSGDQFGQTVAISGNTIVIGASAANNNEGAAYVFTGSGSAWTQAAKLTVPGLVSGDCFGISVAISGNTIVVGESMISTGPGAAYVFTGSGSVWTQTAELTASDGTFNGYLGSYFGGSVSIDGNTIAVGADSADSNKGEAYVFTGSGSAWTQDAILTASDGADAGGTVYGDELGWSVSISGNTVVAGAPYATVNGVNQAGAAYVFTEAPSGWANMTQTAKLSAADSGVAGDFGLSVSICGNTIVAGAWGDQIGNNNEQGAAYVFTNTGSGWANITTTTKLIASDGAATDFFGTSVAAGASLIVVGAPQYGPTPGDYDPPDGNTGAAYVFASPVVVGPVIGSVVAVDTKTQSGVLQSADPLEITWAVNGAASVGSKSLMVNGKAVSTIYGPYSGGADTWYFGGTFGPLSAGSHTYSIQSADNQGNSAPAYTGSFSVVGPASITISSVVAVDTKTQSGVLQSTDPLEITWAVNGAASAGSKSLMVDGQAVSTIYGPYSGGADTWYFGGTFGPLRAGSHTYSIQSADNRGNSAPAYTGSFSVVGPASITISSVVAVDAKTQSGVLQSADPLEITWAVNGAASVGSKSLMVDGQAVSTIYGPYSGGADTWYFGGTFGPLSAGSHTYSIQSADNQGNSAPAYTGSFSVVSPASITISSVVAVDTKTQSGVLQSADPLEITWAVNGAASAGSKSLMVDGQAVSTIYGPYSGGADTWYFGGTFGPLRAGSHTYSIQSADNQGDAAPAYTGSISVVAPLMADASAAVLGASDPLADID